MDEKALLARRQHTHAIVEGALLGDIAIVFLLMRVYLPVPVVRNLLRAVASVPFVMLMQRRGLKITILAAIASYVLFSALVGPILALPAIDVAVAGILVGLGRSAGIPAALNTLWSGAAYAVLDVILPTIATVFIFRYPVKDLITAAKNFFHSVFNLVLYVLTLAGAPRSTLHQVKTWQVWSVTHWQVSWIILMILYGMLMMYLVVIVGEMVLRQLPNWTLVRQRRAA